MSKPNAAFEELYLRTRRDLLLQTYALTGDLPAARSAVGEAFVAARHHWSKVSLLEDPLDWIRPRAWAASQRRHLARLWHSDRDVDQRQRAVLDALHDLPEPQRRALLLVDRAGVPPHDAGRELGLSLVHLDRELASARRAFTAATGSDDVSGQVALLEPLVDDAALPRPGVVLRGAISRTRRRLLASTVLIVAAILLSGMFVATERTVSSTTPEEPEAAPVPRASRAMLLDPASVSPLAPRQQWRPVGTSDNTAGTGINTSCQRARFADQQGVRALVRRFSATGSPRRGVVETVEISQTPQASAAAYGTVVGWFAGCADVGVQLLNTYRITGIGEQGQLIKLRLPNAPRRTYLVGVARTGAITLSTVIETIGARPPEVTDAVALLDRALDRYCGTREAGTCPVTPPQVRPVLPPPSGETPGTLAVGDLPPVPRVTRPWVGTAPGRGVPNLAATLCDRADFAKSGAPSPLSRNFVIPDAKLPQRFGLTETWGSFGRAPRAQRFVAQVTAAMRSCERRRLGSEVSSEIVEDRGYRGSQYAMWRLDAEINDSQETVGYWMGVARVGPWAAQVTFTPVGGNDVDEETFRALLTRARDRLFELLAPPAPAPTTPAPTTPAPSPAPTTTSSPSAR